MENIKIIAEKWDLDKEFITSRSSDNSISTVKVEIHDGNYIGCGECTPNKRMGSDLKESIFLIESLKNEILAGLTSEQLIERLPSCPARSAIDCALWDIKLKKNNINIFDYLGVEPKKTVSTFYTISLDSPHDMARQAKKLDSNTHIKLKLNNYYVEETVGLVREAAPNSKIIIDANESWSVDSYTSYLPNLQKNKIQLIEQPFSKLDSRKITSLSAPIPLCADESCSSLSDLKILPNFYTHINIKLDKVGGLTSGLQIMEEAKLKGIKVSVGCMLSTSLAIVPALIIANDADIVDLDGPLLLGKDRLNKISYNNLKLGLIQQHIWG